MAATAKHLMKKYVFKPYKEIFPELFQKERERIASKVNLQLVIEHIGSTAGFLVKEISAVYQFIVKTFER